MGFVVDIVAVVQVSLSIELALPIFDPKCLIFESYKGPFQ